MITMADYKGFRRSHLTDDLFSKILNGIEKEASLSSWSALNKSQNRGLLTDTISRNENEDNRITGLTTFKLQYTLPKSDKVLEKDIIIKSKVRTTEVIEALVKLIPKSEEEFCEMFKKFATHFELSNAEHIELACSQQDNINLKSVRPEVYWNWTDQDEAIYVFAMEYLHAEDISHFESYSEVDIWQDDDILTALDGLALFHAGFYNDINKIPSTLMQYIDRSYKDRLITAEPFLKVCLERNVQTGSWSREGSELGHKILHSISEICDIIDSAPKTLIHNDAHPNNICLRKNITDEGTHRFCMYDWELCMLGPPQYDAAFFLVCVLPWNTDLKQWDYYVERYHLFLEKHLQSKKLCVSKKSSFFKDGKISSLKLSEEIEKKLEFVDRKKVFDMCICVAYIYRLNWIYAVLLPATDVTSFMPRVLNNAVKYIAHVTEKYNF